MISRLFRGLAVVATCVFAAACTSSDGGSPIAATPLTQASPSRMALAFEPLVGIPEERAAVLAEELGAGAIARGLPVVPRNSSDDSYRVKGYFSVTRSGSATDVQYVWDIFDAAGGRVHRLSGTDTVSAALPDPWQAVTDDSLRRIARETVEGLGSWIDEGAPVTNTPTPAPGSADMTPALGSAIALVASGTPIPRDAISGSVTPSRDSRHLIHVGPVSGAVGDGAVALSAAMARQLSAMGSGAAASPEGADYVVSGESTVGPAHEGTQTVAIIWSVARGNGDPVGTVRQVSRVPANHLDQNWGVSAERAASAAAPGVLGLIAED